MPTSDDFAPYLGQTMRFGPAELVLTEVEARSGTSFNLILRGPPAPVLPEGLHEAEAAGRAFGPLYISPVHTPGGGGQDYQVVFN